MVLQADAPIPVWGKATPGAAIAVKCEARSARTAADKDGFWQVRLEPLPASAAPVEMTVSEAGPGAAPNSSVTLRDILVGEVWIAGGQSNMAYGLDAMEGKEAALASAHNPRIRLFNVRHALAVDPLGLLPGQASGDVEGKWELADARSAGAFSAVAYLFGMELERSLQRPVGLISSNWGGTPIQTWMGLEAFARSPLLSHLQGDYDAAVKLHKQLVLQPEIEANYVAQEKQWRAEVGDAQDAAMRRWNLLKATGADAGPQPRASRPEPQNPDPTGYPSSGSRPQTPSISWNAMYAPLARFVVKGALWYQGEANVSRYRDYGLELRTMVEDWRAQWEEPAMEFLCVQLPGFGANAAKSDLAHLREQQASVLELAHTGLAVSYDVGDAGNVHPASKVDVAHRLALIARGQVYGEKVAYRGPRMQSVSIGGPAIRVRFDTVDGALTIGQAPWVARDGEPLPADRLVGFALAGADGAYHPAEARIEGNSVVVSSPEVAEPRFVRYAWDSTPRANLYNTARLPAAPFRTDTEP